MLENAAGGESRGEASQGVTVSDVWGGLVGTVDVVVVKRSANEIGRGAGRSLDGRRGDDRIGCGGGSNDNDLGRDLGRDGRGSGWGCRGSRVHGDGDDDGDNLRCVDLGNVDVGVNQRCVDGVSDRRCGGGVRGCGGGVDSVRDNLGDNLSDDLVDDLKITVVVVLVEGTGHGDRSPGEHNES